MPSLDECTGERRTKVTGTGLEPQGWGGLVGKGFDRGQSVSDEAANGRTVVFSGMRTLADLWVEGTTEETSVQALGLKRLESAVVTV